MTVQSTIQTVGMINGIAVFILFVGSIAFYVACSSMRRNDGSGKSRLREMHHFYIGIALLLAGFLLGADWLKIVGAVLAAEDAAVHGYQFATAVRTAGGEWLYRPDWEVGVIHRLAHWSGLI